jgi:sugar lactone lactonase YvrE
VSTVPKHTVPKDTVPKHTITDLVTGRAFLECPRWRGDRLWMSDLHRHEVLSVTMSGHVTVEATLDDQPAGLGFLPDGTPIVASLFDRVLLRIERDGRLTRHGDLTALTIGGTNDMVMDSRGRAFVGSFGYDYFAQEQPKPACVVRVEPDGTAAVAAEDLDFPNGMVITPDERTLIVAESNGHRLSAFDLAEDGSLSGRRVFAELGTDPDGICRDVDGAIWVALPRAKRFVRVLDGGEITDTIEVPGRRAVACALGGPDGHTLFAITAKFWRDAAGETVGESRLEVTRVDVPAHGQ